jgi:hypothetical protein
VAIGRGHAGQHRPRVELAHDAHDRDAGLREAVDDRAMHRRGAAVGGQQRRVHVDHAHGRNRQERVRENLAVRRHHAEIDAQIAKRVEEGRHP